MKNTIGKLEPVNIKEVWPDEEDDFTPWMEREGLKMLLEEIGLASDSMTIDREAKCGRQNRSEVDLVAKISGGGDDAEDEQIVVVENQYNECDGNHLGRLLMYAANKKASVVIWVVESGRPDYVNTINWLNEHSADDVSYYLVQVLLKKIGDSSPAPMFKILAQPNEEEEFVDRNVQRSETQNQRFDFWNSFVSDPESTRILGEAGFTQCKVSTEQWRPYTVGSSNVWLHVGIAKERIKANFTMKNNSDACARLTSEEALSKMKECLGENPERGKSDTKTYTTVNFYRDINVARGAAEQEAARKWFVEMLPKMKSFLVSERIK